MNLTSEQAEAAREWAKAGQAWIDAKDGDKPELRKAENELRAKLWALCKRDLATFDVALEAVGRKRVVSETGPRIAKAGTREPYFPKKSWTPTVGHRVRVKLFEPDVHIDGVIVAEERYGRYFVWTAEYHRTMVGKSRLYPIHDGPDVLTTDVSTLPAEALVPLKWEKDAKPPAKGEDAG